MTVTRLTAVPAVADRAAEGPGARVRRLQDEARQLAAEQVEALAHALSDLGAQAAEISTGGEAYPIGVREMASRLASDLPDRAQAMLVLLNRVRGLAT
jgi:hypothetical protein